MRKILYHFLAQPILYFGFLIAASAVALGGDIVLSLEEPTPNSTYTGVANIRGWAVGSSGIKRIELYLDDQYQTDIPIGGKRSDVANAYPSYPNSQNSGFSMAFNYSNISAVGHNMRVRAIGGDGTLREQAVNFSVVRFATPFISNPKLISLAQALLSHDDQSIYINGLVADNATYDVRLDWRTAIQGYTITHITKNGSKTKNEKTEDIPTDLWELNQIHPTSISDTPRAGQGGNTILSLEEPAPNSIYPDNTYTGVANIRGWVVNSTGINRVELYIDDQYETNIPVGGNRSDVGASYPTYPNSSNSGFSMAFNYSSIPIAGWHNIRVRAVGNDGSIQENTAQVYSVRFATPFISDPRLVSLAGALLSHDNQSINISGLIIKSDLKYTSNRYDIRLDWRTATQGYAITQITPAGGDGDVGGIQCPTGYHLSGNSCVPDSLPPCPTGQHRDPSGNCVWDACPTGQHRDPSGNCVWDACPTGQHRDPSGRCVPDGCTSLC